MAQASKQVDAAQESKEVTFLDDTAMVKHMEELCSANDLEKKDLCILINLCDIDPTHQWPHKKDVESDPSAISDSENFLLKLSSTRHFSFKAYKLQHGKYGVIANGDERDVRKQFVEPLQGAIDTTCAEVQFAASFGITARFQGEKQVAWRKRATEALRKATAARKKYNLTSEIGAYEPNYLRRLMRSFIVTEYAQSIEDDEKKQSADQAAESIFPDDFSMIKRIKRICQTDDFENRNVLVLIEISLTQDIPVFELSTASMQNLTKADDTPIENILAEYKKKKQFEVFHVDAYGAGRGYGLIVDDVADVLEVVERIENNNLYQASFGIARRAKSDLATEWLERAEYSKKLKSGDGRRKEKIGTTKNGTDLFISHPTSDSKGSIGF